MRNRVLLAVAAGAVAIGALAAWHGAVTPKRFGVVQAGRLYRCGDITPTELEAVVKRHGIRSVLSLLNASAPETVAERDVAARLGVRWFNVPLTGDGASTPEDREAIKRIALDDANGPLLVHCSAGTNRTGLACGLYRIHRQGWTYEQVLAEMRGYGFDDLPKHQNLRDALAEAAAARDAEKR